jgi:hypothetical protein
MSRALQLDTKGKERRAGTTGLPTTPEAPNTAIRFGVCSGEVKNLRLCAWFFRARGRGRELSENKTSSVDQAHSHLHNTSSELTALAYKDE